MSTRREAETDVSTFEGFSRGGSKTEPCLCPTSAVWVANLLADAGVPEPEPEYRIVDDGGDLILQADLAWPRLKKAWELDGLQFHFGRTDFERDKRKRNRAKTFGWNIQEILWSMYVDEPLELVRMARQFLDEGKELRV